MLDQAAVSRSALHTDMNAPKQLFGMTWGRQCCGVPMLADACGRLQAGGRSCARHLLVVLQVELVVALERVAHAGHAVVRRVVGHRGEDLPLPVDAVAHPACKRPSQNSSSMTCCIRGCRSRCPALPADASACPAGLQRGSLLLLAVHPCSPHCSRTLLTPSGVFKLLGRQA